ncbi:hypothetical protein [Clostridium sp.]|uniref:hypothetical protein n=1 Tax=Clostridium sp. TaxID=1506 RepID=UPI00284A82C7|nr:hypothetical protein [Clostridium sp.]MDR3595705.1 hypothetical protein [Clostridium sp.]
MYTLVSSKYDIAIIFLCLGILMFVSSMITAEIQKKKNKFKYGVFNLLYIIGFFLIIIAAAKFNLDYIFNLAIYISGAVILGKDIISFRVRKKCSNERCKAVKIRGYWIGSIITFLVVTLLNKVDNPKFELVEIYFIIVLLIDLPIAYSLNHYLNIYESGIAISTFSFPKKILPYDEIIPYENIENINLAEYQKNRFILKIKVKDSKRKSPYEYIIKGEGKEEFVSFIEDYIEEDKITYII